MTRDIAGDAIPGLMVLVAICGRVESQNKQHHFTSNFHSVRKETQSDA